MRRVRDPVTGKDVWIADTDINYKDAVDNPVMSVPNENLGKATTVRVSPDQSGEEYRRNQDLTAPPDPVQPGSTSDVPIRSEKTSVVFSKTPSVSYEPMFAVTEQRANVLCVGIFFSIVLFGHLFGANMWGLLPLGACVSSGIFIWAKDLIKHGRDFGWKSEQDQGETATANLIPESVEWINTALGLIWGMINPEMFAAVVDTIEDVMAASVPGVIENVRVADIFQGNNPLRILNICALPDAQVQDIKDEIRRENEKVMDPDELEATEQVGKYYNLEVSVAYHAKPSTSDISSKAKNMGMHLIFYLGVKGLFGIPLPIWVELLGLVATARVRVQLTPEPPFAKTLTVTLMGAPKVQAGCTPMVERGVNILNLPLISNFVNWAIRTTASMYVAPKSLTLDLSKMLQGDDVPKETEALGVLFIRIRKAVGLSKQDQRGSKGGGSDPYITIAWSKFSKPQFCTRVIQDDLNPIFEESCGLLVTSDLVKADEQLSVELWDSDRASADDMVGKVELSIQKLMQHPGRMFSQVSMLRGVKTESTMPGSLHWEVGFFEKTRFRKALRTDGGDANVARKLRSRRELQDDRGAINTAEDAVVHTPSDPLWPSGIISVVIHQMVGLDLANTKGSNGKRKGREYGPAWPDAGDVKEEESKSLPSSYCTILLNDELVSKTRTRVTSSQPIFNAGTERFVRDWRSAIATVTVRDARHREHDPIIGVVTLKLSNVLFKGSQVTRWYPLSAGVGFGRARISILFRSCELRLPPPQLGWEVGTFQFTSNITAHGYGSGRMKMRLRTGGSSATVKRVACTSLEGGIGASWDVGCVGWQNYNDYHYYNDIPTKHPKLRLAVRYRYRSPIFFELCPSGKRSPDAYAALWLQELPDLEALNFDIPILRCGNPMRLSQNYITEENFRDVPDMEDMEVVGRLQFRGRFSTGTDRYHLPFVSDNNDLRETIETWKACFTREMRQEEVQVQVPPEVQRLHDKPLAEAGPDERERWLARDGADWRHAFSAGADTEAHDDFDDN